MRVIYAFFVVFVALTLTGCRDQSGDQQQVESGVFDRVTSSKVIRAGYISYPPSLIVDPNTKDFSGISHDIFKKASDNLGFRLEMAEEVGWSSMIEALDANRVDVVVTSIWPTAARGIRADFITPTFYSYVKAYVRANDDRFDGNLAVANTEATKIAVVDGEIAETIANADFPKAQQVSLTQVSDVTQLLLEVASNKADITFVEPAIALAYMEKNPGTIKEVSNVKPLRLFPNSFMIKKGEYKLKTMLDTAVTELINSGYVNKVISKYEKYPGSFGRVSPRAE